MERENFYLLLELTLEPPETNDEVIWEAIQKKKAEWSRLRNHPTKGLQAQKYINLIPEIQRVMMYQDYRQKEAVDAIQILKKGKADKYIEIDRHIDILLGKGFVDKEEIAKLAQVHNIDEDDIKNRVQMKIEEKFKRIDEQISIRMAKGYLTEKDISKMAERHSISADQIRERIRCPIAKDNKEKIVPPRPLDKTIEKSILENLKIINKSSLYDFLDAPVCSDLKTVQEKASLKKKELSNFSKKDADITAGTILAGYCLTIFKNEESRYSYDVSLANARLGSLYSDIDMAAIEGKIRPEYFDILVQKAVEIGMDEDEASDFIEAYCKTKNYKAEKKAKTDKIKDPKMAIAAGIAVAVIVVLGTTFFYIHQKGSASSEYQILQEKVNEQSSLENKEKLLEDYLNTHKAINQFTKDAAASMKQIESQIAENQFAKVVSQAEKSTRDGNPEQAIALYQDYLKTGPPEDKKSQINEKIKLLSEQIEKSDFDKLSQIALTGEADQKIAAFQDYLKKYPNGAHKAQVENLLKDMSGEYFIFVKNKLASYEQKQDWQACLDLCNKYISIYDNSNSDQIKLLMPDYQEKIRNKTIFQSLVEKADKFGDDYSAAKKIYTDYLDAYPETPLKEKIQGEINRVDKLAALQSIDTEEAKLRKMISAEAHGRFVEKQKGVVVDTKTGLMWCLVDARTAKPNDCIDYKEANKYVKQLNTAGYTDWRLPTPAELAGIFQTTPSFPSLYDSDWYWSSENYTSYSDGWHVRVSTLGRENNGQWEPLQKDSKQCGNVRAVRGK